MNSVEFDHLAIQVDHLIRVIETLQLENATLRQKMAVHIKERAYLQHLNQRAAKQIKQVIKQIKEEMT